MKNSLSIYNFYSPFNYPNNFKNPKFISFPFDNDMNITKKPANINIVAITDRIVPKIFLNNNPSPNHEIFCG